MVVGYPVTLDLPGFHLSMLYFSRKGARKIKTFPQRAQRQSIKLCSPGKIEVESRIHNFIIPDFELFSLCVLCALCGKSFLVLALVSVSLAP
jgi:hypothetical protein